MSLSPFKPARLGSVKALSALILASIGLAQSNYPGTAYSETAIRTLVANMMTITVRTLTGEAYEMRISPNMSVASFKRAFAQLSHIPVADQRPMFIGRKLVDGRRLSEYGIKHGSIIFVIILGPSPVGGPGG